MNAADYIDQQLGTAATVPPGMKAEDYIDQQLEPPAQNTTQAQPTEQELPTGTAAFVPELKTAINNSGEMAASGARDVAEALTPVSALAKMGAGYLKNGSEGALAALSPEDREYLDQDTLSGVVSPTWDALKALGKGMAGGAGLLGGAALSAANRAFVGNPVENATGIPSGATDFALSLAEPWGIEKTVSGLASLAPETVEAPKALSAVQGLLSEKTPETVTEAAKMAAPEVAGTTAAAPAVTPSEIPLSGGQASQIPDLQRFEADALAGAKGQEAQSKALQFNEAQQQAVSEMLGNLGEYKAGGNPADSVGSVAKLIKANEGAAANDVNEAYKAARGLSDGLRLPAGDMQANLIPQIDGFAKDFRLKQATTPKAFDAMQDLKELAQTNSGAALLDDGEAWRRSVGNLASKTNDPAEASAMRGLIKTYDTYTGDLASRLSSAGDQKSADAIQAFKNAVAARAAYGDKFQGNPLVENLISGNKSIDDVTEDLLGKNQVANRQGMLDNLNGIMRAAGDQAPLVKSQLQNAYAQKIYDTVAGSKIAGTNTDSLSFPKLQTALENTFVKNREFATALYGPDAVASAQEAIKTLDLANSRQANVGNAPSSGYTAARLMQNTSGWLSHVPGLKHIVNLVTAAAKASAEAESAKTAGQTFSGVVPDKFLPQTPSLPTLRIGAGVSGANSVNNQ